MEQRKTPVAYLNCCEAAVVSRVKLCISLLPLLCYERIRFKAAYTQSKQNLVWDLKCMSLVSVCDTKILLLKSD